MAHLSISLLGPFVVEMDDQVVTGFAYDKVRALLAYLAVESSRPNRREHLVGLLWPELPEVKGLSNLRTALYDLRSVIHDRQTTPPFLTITHTTLQLNPEGAVWVDVVAFRESLAAEGARSNAAREGAATAAGVIQAVELYRGDLLQGLSVESGPFEDWVLVQREALRLQMLEGLEGLIAFYLERGDHERVYAYARRQVALEPLREKAHRHVIRALVALGRRAEAVAQYESCRRLLHEKLEIEPEPATRALLAQVRAGRLAAGHGEDASSSPTEAEISRAPAWETAAVDGEAGEAGRARQGSGVAMAVPGLVGPWSWSPETIATTVHSAEDLRRRAGAIGESVVMAAAQAAVDIARAAGGVGTEALGHLYAGVVLANTTGAGFQASLAHLGRALALAQAAHMPGMAPEILRYLGLGSLGETADGERVFNQALALYRQLGHREGESRMLGVLALASLDLGDLAAARRYAEEGLGLARDIGDRHEEGVLSEVLGEVGLLQWQYGTSQRCLQTALASFRDVAALEGEAAALRALGVLLDTLGAYDRAQQVLIRAFEVLPQGSSPASVMAGWCSLGQVSLHSGDEVGAATWAGKTLALLDSLGDGRQRSCYPRLRAAVLALRGQVLARQGRQEDAAVAYREAMAVRQRGRWPGVAAEARAGLAELALLYQGPRSALAEMEGGLPQLAAGDLVGAAQPMRVFLVAYRVLRASEDARAPKVLARAREFQMAAAGSIEDEGLRRSYLVHVAANREIAAAVAGAPDEREVHAP